MREIIFRGKTLTGRWVEGAYYKQEEFYGDKEDAHIIITSKETLDNDYALERYVVIPETVGQWTGLTDKNGKRVFEGDIVERAGDKCIIKWIENDAKFIIIGGITKLDFSLLFAEHLQVIGNITDNPELLKGGENG